MINTIPPAYVLVHKLPERIRVKLFALKFEPTLAAGLEHELMSQSGVRSASASAQTCSLTIEFDAHEFDPDLFLRQLRLQDLVLKNPRKNKLSLPFPLRMLRTGTLKFERIVSPGSQFILATASLVFSVCGAPPVITKLVLSAAILPIANRAIQTLIEERRLGAEGLDAFSCVVLMRSGGLVTASIMTFLIGVGEYVRDLITRRCESLIDHQLALSEHSAWLIKGRKRVRMPIIDLRPGDHLVVYPGELIAFHGVIESGSGTVVPSSPELDFEPQLVERGGYIAPETLLASGKIYAKFEACKFGTIHDLAKQKQKKRLLQRTKLHRRALRIGYERVFPMIGLAACLFLVTRDIHRALTVICYDFLTGIRITLPVAVLSSMYKAGLSGAVIKDAGTLERLSEVDVVVFARSGTLTELHPEVTQVHVLDGFTLEDVTRYAGAVEQRYDHLAAHAIYSFAEIKKIPVPDRISATAMSGLGVRGDVEGHSVMVGSTRLMQLENIDITAARNFLEKCTNNGDSRACVVIDGKLAGIIAYRDPIRSDAKEVVSQLRQLGIKDIVMSTGASEMAADKLAHEAGITSVFARQTAEHKMQLVKDFRNSGFKVAVVGSDLNDAIALEQADVAITLGTGTEIARHRADVVLDSESLLSLVEAIKISREGMSLSRQNLKLISVPNWFGLGLSILGGSEALSATLLNNGSVIVGVANGLRPLVETDDLEDDEVPLPGASSGLPNPMQDYPPA